MKFTKLCDEKLKLNLQLFTGDGGDGGEGGSDQPITFGSQAELDSMIDKRTAKALETAHAKWKEQAEKERQEALTEGQRMAQMSEAERKEEEARKQSEAEAKREADLTSRELRLTALEELATRELPKELIGAVVTTNADDCKKSIEAIETAFRSAVEAGVNERLKSSVDIPAGSGGGNGKPEKGSIGKRLAQQHAQETKESNFFK
ncbi:DUF4355 domain-containing protein [Enterococcus olivae]